ncbi:hypothetical protein Tco_1045774 [Tanacetum coccineum]|uniref:Uncharacterized protein n=1 Tax=Tanacetum coccineum TaxID=301880 RepID=A0ABQ5GUS0_9ASTR
MSVLLLYTERHCRAHTLLIRSSIILLCLTHGDTDAGIYGVVTSEWIVVMVIDMWAQEEGIGSTKITLLKSNSRISWCICGEIFEYTNTRATLDTYKRLAFGGTRGYLVIVVQGEGAILRGARDNEDDRYGIGYSGERVGLKCRALLGVSVKGEYTLDEIESILGREVTQWVKGKVRGEEGLAETERPFIFLRVVGDRWRQKGT